MKFTPKSEKELKEANLIEPGIYDFEVMTAINKKSKSGDDMIELRLKVWDKDGKERTIFDFLTEKMLHKVKHFSDVAKLSDKYESGNLDAFDCIGKSGKAKIGIQKDKTGEYPDKNTVKDYVSDEEINLGLEMDGGREKDPFDINW